MVGTGVSYIDRVSQSIACFRLVRCSFVRSSRVDCLILLNFSSKSYPRLLGCSGIRHCRFAATRAAAMTSLQELHRAHLKRTAELFGGEQASLRGGEAEEERRVCRSH